MIARLLFIALVFQISATAQTSPFKYDYAEPFKNGVAQVKIGTKVGFIDKTGREFIPVKYDAIYYNPVSDKSVIKLKLDDKYGLVDLNGNVVVPFQYRLMDDFSEDLVEVYLEGKGVGYIDKTGKIAVPLKYQIISGVLDGLHFSNGLGAVKLNNKCGYVDKTGKEVIALKYDKAANFSEGLAAVTIDKKSGFINTAGKEITALKYNKVENFKDGIAGVYSGGNQNAYGEAINGKWGFIDKTGKEIVAPTYDNIWSSPQDGLIKVTIGSYPNEKFGFINKNGKEIWELGKYSYATDFSEGVAFVGNSEKKYALIDKTGKLLTAFIYEWDNGYPRCTEGLVPAKLDGKFGYIDKTGKNRIKHEYGYAGNFQNGYATVGNDKLYGMIDKTGKLVIPIKYQWISKYADGWFLVQQNDKYSFIDVKEKFIQ